MKRGEGAKGKEPTATQRLKCTLTAAYRQCLPAYCTLAEADWEPDCRSGLCLLGSADTPGDIKRTRGVFRWAKSPTNTRFPKLLDPFFQSRDRNTGHIVFWPVDSEIKVHYFNQVQK